MGKIPLNTLVISTEKCGHWGAVDANTVGFTFREDASKIAVEHAVNYKQIKPV